MVSAEASYDLCLKEALKSAGTPGQTRASWEGSCFYSASAVYVRIS